ncbi:uncharacterized protein BP5553_02799 [Venustampulla echinocandica]|uniref:Uncharacterized protein n=1 Tax=Venustampulla echinocandica TaxID=2656787 RepID=A0A370TSE9_9HELO|nr:uncharacterized protein BP5553_02799 [Venustampulla echinocandica]RDL38459.1 hypothetical protein BP5553_02799 [Venustampulla echinocandica]
MSSAYPTAPLTESQESDATSNLRSRPISSRRRDKPQISCKIAICGPRVLPMSLNPDADAARLARAGPDLDPVQLDSPMGAELRYIDDVPTNHPSTTIGSDVGIGFNSLYEPLIRQPARGIYAA